ncbi:MAG: CotH kinase family protein [Pirellulaceae bacterium]|nr:CotH kinase family protein [Pirellulaceae bacterium]
MKTTCGLLILLATSSGASQTAADPPNSHSSANPCDVAEVADLLQRFQPPTATPEEQTASDAFFGMTKLWEIHIQFSPDEWQAIQPPANVNWDVGSAFQDLMRDAEQGKHLHSEKSTRPGLAGYLGVDHQYGRADVTMGHETLEEVGVRYKGNGTFVEGHHSGKYSFKIDFNKYQDEQEYRGLTKVNLNSCVSDPSMLREALSYELFKAAGIPVPRIAWAKVYLTVTGQKQREYQGLYELVEQVDKRFLKHHFGSAAGLLVKPSTFGIFRYLGEDWEDYHQGYYPKTTGTPELQQRMIAFARLIHLSEAETFHDEIEDYLDIDPFLNFLAVNVILSNLDSFLGGSQNYYAYLHPETKKVLLLPWDLDHSFGTLGLLGTPDSRRDLTIYQPHVGDDHPLVARILDIPEYRQAYLERIEQLLEGPFAKAKMFQQIDAAGSFLRPLVALEGDRALADFEIVIGKTPQPKHPHVLKYFVVQRHKSITQQLSGKSTGQKARWNEFPFSMDQVLTWLGIGIAVALSMMLNAGAWLWGVIGGFRGSTRWGVLNMFFYPVTPITYGFFVRKDLGRRAAIMVFVAALILLVVVIVSMKVAGLL